MSVSPSITHNETHTTSTTSNSDPMPPKTPLTLILAATPSLGIGRAGGLPWPPHKTDMGFFVRVTKRVPANISNQNNRKYMNAVVMGRKTWESIPTKFRPLAGRVNVVISSSDRVEGIGKEEAERSKEPVILAKNLESALELLNTSDSLTRSNSSASSLPSDLSIARIFIIGGASIYKAALELDQTNRILLTRIGKEYECDTFFSLDLSKEANWARRGTKDLQSFTGEEVGEGLREEKGVPFEFCMLEKV